jgi:type I restriction enzyme R subunit
VRLYQYVAQLVDFGDPDLEAFANYASLLRKRLKGISPEQVDLGDLKLTHYKMKKEGGLDGIGDAADARAQYGISDNGQRDARDRKKKYLSELIENLNRAFGKDISDKDQVAFAVHVSEKLRDDHLVMAQVQNNSRDQAMKADLPQAIIQAITNAFLTHQTIATKLLSDDESRAMFTDVVYQLLKQDQSTDLFLKARETDIV